jgi:2-polyprenyl-6-methoxyphenol hydroxylase-like FAD-dependent oxidoreductase
MIVVIGSGPSGVSSALPLVEAGHAVTLLDGGCDLEPESISLGRDLGHTDPANWPPATVRLLKETMTSEGLDSDSFNELRVSLTNPQEIPLTIFRSPEISGSILFLDGIYMIFNTDRCRVVLHAQHTDQ